MKKDIKKWQGNWKKMCGNNIPSKFLVCTVSILMFWSCSPRSSYQQRIDEYQVTPGKRYELAVAIGEYAHYFPDDVEILPEYAEILLTKGFYDECISICDHILERENNAWETYYTRAMAKSLIWDFDGSLNDLQIMLQNWKTTKKIEESQSLIRQYAEIHESIQILDKKIRDHPTEYSLYKNRGDLFLSMNEPVAAIADYRFCLDSAGFDHEVIWNKFRAEILNFDFEAAEQDIEQIRLSNIQDSMMNLELMSSLITDARNHSVIIKNDPGNIDSYLELARIFTFLEIEHKAIEYLSTALEIQPDNIQVKYHMAVVYAFSDKKDKASKILTELETQGVQVPDQLKKMIE